jgi:hypothetical protein
MKQLPKSEGAFPSDSVIMGSYSLESLANDSLLLNPTNCDKDNIVAWDEIEQLRSSCFKKLILHNSIF